MARPANGSDLNIAVLERMLNDRRVRLNRLERRRNTLMKRVDAIDREIAKVGGGSGGGGGGERRRGPVPGSKRVRNDKPLPDVMEEVMKQSGKPMRVGDIVEAVLGTGYKSGSANFKGIVNQMLIKERKRFNAVERGVYGLKK